MITVDSEWPRVKYVSITCDGEIDSVELLVDSWPSSLGIIEGLADES